MVMHQAQDTFVAEIDGAPLVVQKGQVYDARHPVVKMDAGRGLLFRPLEETPEPEPAKPVKPAAKKAGA
jgi:hypothetical protein